eukprot:CAMPEP_0206242096 /NCGR_PEP_ID=MMETSP0047_2-20121206/16867_1 /ASSEMBLY_ACC=CAM_ASM_000192 /TAXON_ID=195065 /ORGANISM="Chroomonas mesostigmatica_cf, Strain CCMP1168" /LENGTH=83 /DNA_ID=CAMNT_0053667077 /DNA_START=310 /DNA_END=561 /DNA_ORIENTATION=-
MTSASFSKVELLEGSGSGALSHELVVTTGKMRSLRILDGALSDGACKGEALWKPPKSLRGGLTAPWAADAWDCWHSWVAAGGE